MFIDCPTCGSSYNVADDKVRGRRVRVRCRNCSNAILVDGRASLPPPPAPPPMPQLSDDDRTRQLSPDDTTRAYGDFAEEEQTRVFSPSQGLSPVAPLAPAPPPPAAGEWTVNLSDTDQQQMSTDAIVDAYNAGLLPDDAYVWKAGMGDWKLVTDVPELRDALNDAGHTRVVDTEFIEEPEYITEPERAPVPVAYAPPAVPPPSSSGRAARTPGPPSARDLFGSVEVAGSEHELLQSQSETSLERYEQQPTGARGNSSVLFSMDAYRRGQTGPGMPPPERAEAAFDMAAPTSAPAVPPSNEALLSAPPRSAPPPPPSAQSRTRDTTPPAAPTPAKKESSGTLVYVLGGIVGIAAMLGAVWYFVLRPKSAPTTPAETPIATVTPSAEPKAAPPTAREPKPEPEPEPEEEDDVAEDESEEPAHDEPAAPAPAPSPAPRSARSPSPRAAPSPAPAPAPAPEPEPEPPSEGPSSSLLEAMKGDVPKVELEDDTPPPEPEEDKPPAPPFNMGAAKAALSAASAGASACKSADGPTGSGKVQVTFATSGRVTSANIISGPFPGTPVGGCVAKKFRAARVPAFSGESVTVAKSFRIPD